MFRAVTGGTVLDRILELESYTEAQAACVIADVLNALHYLHNIGITHRDLKVCFSFLPREPNSSFPHFTDTLLAQCRHQHRIPKVCYSSLPREPNSSFPHFTFLTEIKQKL